MISGPILGASDGADIDHFDDGVRSSEGESIDGLEVLVLQDSKSISEGRVIWEP